MQNFYIFMDNAASKKVPSNIPSETSAEVKKTEKKTKKVAIREDTNATQIESNRLSKDHGNHPDTKSNTETQSSTAWDDFKCLWQPTWRLFGQRWDTGNSSDEEEDQPLLESKDNRKPPPGGAKPSTTDSGLDGSASDEEATANQKNADCSCFVQPTRRLYQTTKNYMQKESKSNDDVADAAEKTAPHPEKANMDYAHNSSWNRVRKAANKAKDEVKPQIASLILQLAEFLQEKAREAGASSDVSDPNRVVVKPQLVNLANFIGHGHYESDDDSGHSSHIQMTYVNPGDSSSDDGDDGEGEDDDFEYSWGDLDDELQVGLEYLNHLEKEKVIDKYALLEMKFNFKAVEERMTVFIGSLKILKENEQKPEHKKTPKIQIRLTLLPAAKFQKSYRSKKKRLKATKFDETVMYKMSYYDIALYDLLITLHECRGMRKSRIVAEAFIDLGTLNHDSDNAKMVALQPFTGESSESGNSSHDNLDPAEIMISLNYRPTEDNIYVTIVKGLNFEISQSKRSITYIELIFLSDLGKELMRYKTTNRPTKMNPEFREMYSFDTSSSGIDHITILINAYVKTGFKTRLKGIVSIGVANSTDEGLSHWNSMKSNHSQDISAWHKLLLM